VLTATLNGRLDVTSFGTVRSQDAAARLARVREVSARQATLDQIHESWSRISNGLAKSRAARAEALASTAAVERARDRYREGAGTHFELVQAERDARSSAASASPISCWFQSASARARSACAERSVPRGTPS